MVTRSSGVLETMERQLWQWSIDSMQGAGEISRGLQWWMGLSCSLKFTIPESLSRRRTYNRKMSRNVPKQPAVVSVAGDTLEGERCPKESRKCIWEGRDDKVNSCETKT